MAPHPPEAGIMFRKGDHTRLAGLMQVHERLRFDPDGKPMMYVFNTCQDFIRTIPTLPYSQTKPEDVDTDAEDHIFDDVRYFCMSRPITPIKKAKPEPKPYDPFTR
jgi:hypothetical protein